MRRKSVKWWKTELSVDRKIDVEVQIRQIVNSYSDRVPLSAKDQNWIGQVLKHHYQYIAKVGCGLKHIEVRTNYDGNKPTRGFWIVRTDGTDIDISWIVAMQPNGETTPQHDVSSSARFEIKGQIDEYHKNGLCAQCPLCNQEMVSETNLHVDHEITFKQLFEDFLYAKGLIHEQVEIEDQGLNSLFADRELATEWQLYHQASATLRLTHDKCNLSRKAA